MLDVYFGDNLAVLPEFESGSFALIYVDPPSSGARLPLSREAAGE